MDSRISLIFTGAEGLLSQLKEGKTYYITRLTCQPCLPEYTVCAKEFSVWQWREIFQAPEDKQLAFVPEHVLSLSGLAHASTSQARCEVTEASADVDVKTVDTISALGVQASSACQLDGASESRSSIPWIKRMETTHRSLTYEVPAETGA